jgi:FAD/FMN-containing dehydrogenase
LDLLASAAVLFDASLFPVAVELVSSGLARKLGITTDSDSSILLVRFAGNEKAVEYERQAALSKLSRSPAVIDTDAITEDTTLWQALAAVPVQVRPDWRASVFPSELGKFVETVSEIYGAPFDSMLWQAGVGCGRVRKISDSEPSSEEDARDRYEVLHNAAHAAGGTLTVESAMPELQTSEGSGTVGAIELSRRIKQQLDPNHVFPGFL